MKPIDFPAGSTFNRWTLVSEAPARGKRRYANAVCACGSEAVVNLQNVIYGKSKSCGCLRKEDANLFKATHGMTETTEYEIWSSMLKRCTNKNNHAYHRYGGRGITVCER